ncbi:hypothetical protein GCM10008965_18970 [Methylorubrum aminovorans]
MLRGHAGLGGLDQEVERFRSEAAGAAHALEPLRPVDRRLRGAATAFGDDLLFTAHGDRALRQMR